MQPGKCKCRLGWTGDDCQQCQQYPNCKHGYCIAPLECICKEGWGGLFCDKGMCFCRFYIIILFFPINLNS